MMCGVLQLSAVKCNKS